MAIRYAIPEVKIRNTSCNVSAPPELLLVIEKWRINVSAIADEIGMKRATLGNKLKGNNGGAFSPDEYKDFVAAMKQMINELQTPLNNYPLKDE